jgi:hypothetical protein
MWGKGKGGRKGRIQGKSGQELVRDGGLMEIELDQREYVITYIRQNAAKEDCRGFIRWTESGLVCCRILSKREVF